MKDEQTATSSVTVGEGVEEPAVQNTQSTRDWALTPGAFERLLNWLDEEVDSGGQRYLEMRRRLVLYFDRKNCLTPDELADETLNRVARRLEEEGTITGDAPAQYCYIVARYVFLESLRKPERGPSLDDTLHRRAIDNAVTQPGTSAADEATEKRLTCLERCMQKLEPEHRELIINYYDGQQRAKIDNRREMAARLGITVNALSIRAFRLREKLESCVRHCAGRDD